MNKNWILEAKIGDEVAHERWGSWHIQTVVGKTATGSLKLDNGDLVKNNEWGSSRNGYNYKPVTDQIRHRVAVQEKGRELRKVINDCSFLDLTLEQMDTLIDIFKTADRKRLKDES